MGFKNNQTEVIMFFYSAMMSGDSTNSPKDYIDFQDSRLSLTPTTSKDYGAPNSTNVAVAASICTTPIDKPETTALLDCTPIMKEGAPTAHPNEDDVPDSTVCSSKPNGTVNRFDGEWKKNNTQSVPGMEKEENEDGCAIKCLYYTLQCCECTIL